MLLYDYCIQRGDDLLLSQWDRARNGALTPTQISHGSHRKVFWRCEQGHQWQAAVYSRSTGGTGCPYCSGQKRLPDVGTLASEFPELAAQWHPTKNSDLFPDQIPPATHRRVWWLCEKGHEWSASIHSRTSGSGCPVCANRVIQTGENDLATTHPKLTGQWHPKKNGSLQPSAVLAGSHRKVWWVCEHGHEWQAPVFARGNGSGCPVCAGKQVVPGENDLASRFPMVAAQWHPTRNGIMGPDRMTAYSNMRIWWCCELGHEYPCVIAHRTQSGVGCPYCAGRKVLPGFNDLETKDPQVAAQWDEAHNGTLTPRMVTAGSRKKVWWRCPLGHIWKAVIYSRTGAGRAGCPVCAGKVKQLR